VSDRELILYAWPIGPLADATQRYFNEVTDQLGSTVAQSYPVHCTLTGFFRRADHRVDAVLAALGAAVDALGAPDDVTVERLGARDGWVGLELRSRQLLDIIEAVTATDRPEPGEDALRPKDWLHVSLAYGVADLRPYEALAREIVDPSLPATWRVGFWERLSDGTWIRR